MTQRYSTDIVIFGGGIAGCWILNKLVNEGYNAILIEQGELGGGQTLASQGIIHGGLKYALNGALTGATNAIANMPQRWRDSLAGTADIDLRGVKVLSENYYMWSNSGIRSKLKTFLGSKTLRGRVESVAQQEYPEFFTSATNAGSLYKLPDFVIETESLLATLVNAQRQRIFQASDDQISFHRNSAGLVSGITIETATEHFVIDTQRTILAAGKGNQSLIDNAGLRSVKMQLRPLNMVYLKSQRLTPVYVHCIGDSFSLTPKLTITSHTDADENTVWYLGGEIAESGVNKSSSAQVDASKKLLASLFPWLNLSDAVWDCLAVDRAEPAVSSNFRPDDAFTAEEDGVIVAWPTKLTLAPSLGDRVTTLLKNSNILPTLSPNKAEQFPGLERPKLAVAPWN
ncbi:MAG: glycine/D-amino acid oxidase-like deaminating enzyme [Pseudohongiellaceae bacterium]|jgi:glycine/D-amino acid oxidase-like deaminating enzyme